MCTEVLIDGAVCGTIGELRAAIGRAPSMCRDRIECAERMPITDDECLCHVDHDATASALGRMVDRDDCLLWQYVRTGDGPGA